MTAKSSPMPNLLRAPGGVLQRKCACGQHAAGGECEECGKKKQEVQRKTGIGSEPTGVPPVVHEVLRAPGQRLDPSTRGTMESYFGHDFSLVHVHSDARAAESVRSVDALAYTVGRDVVFGAGQYAPDDARATNEVRVQGRADTQDQVLSEEELEALTPVTQASSTGTTPDGNSLGPTDPEHRACLGQRFYFSRGPDHNTATEARAESRVTARLKEPPEEAGDCRCGCALFRQFIRGFWRAGSPTAAKQSKLGSCGRPLTLSETTFVEEFGDCDRPALSPDCKRLYLDTPGFERGLRDGLFVQMHMVFRYQIWDQCRGRSRGFADHVLDIWGDRSPRSIKFT